MNYLRLYFRPSKAYWKQPFVRPPHRQFFAQMSTAPTRQRFFVYAPDKTAEGIFQLRLSVREQHLVGVKAAIESGTIRKTILSTHKFLLNLAVGVGGFFTTPESIATPTSERKVIGSTFICEADSIDEYGGCLFVVKVFSNQ